MKKKKINFRKSKMRVLDSLESVPMSRLYESDDFKNRLKDKSWDEDSIQESLERFFEGDYGDNLPAYIIKSNNAHKAGKSDLLIGKYYSPVDKSEDSAIVIFYSKKDDSIRIMSSKEFFYQDKSKEIEKAIETMEKEKIDRSETENELQTEFLNENTRVLEGYDFANSLKDIVWSDSEIQQMLYKFHNGDYGDASDNVKRINEQKVKNQYGDILGIYKNGSGYKLDDLIIYYNQSDNCIYLLSRADFGEFKEYWLLGSYKGRMTSGTETPEEYSQRLVSDPVLKKYLSEILRPGDLLSEAVPNPKKGEEDKIDKTDTILESIDKIKNAIDTVTNTVSVNPKEKEYVLNYLYDIYKKKTQEMSKLKKKGTSYTKPGYKLNTAQREEIRNLWTPQRTPGKIREENANLVEVKDLMSNMILNYSKADDEKKSALEDKVMQTAKKFENKKGLINRALEILKGIVLKSTDEKYFYREKDEFGNYIKNEDGKVVKAPYPKVVNDEEAELMLELFPQINDKIARNNKEIESLRSYGVGANYAGVATKRQIQAIEKLLADPEHETTADPEGATNVRKSRLNEAGIAMAKEAAAKIPELAEKYGVSPDRLYEKIAERMYLYNDNFVRAWTGVLKNLDKPYYLTEDSKTVKDSVKYVVYLNGEAYVTVDTEDDAYRVESEIYSAANTQDDFQSYYGSYPDVVIKKKVIADVGPKPVQRETKHKQKSSQVRPNALYDKWRFTDCRFDLINQDIEGVNWRKETPGDHKKIDEYAGRIIIFGEHYFVNNGSVISKTTDFAEFKYDTNTNKFTIYGLPNTFTADEKKEIEEYAVNKFRNEYLKLGNLTAADFEKIEGVKFALKNKDGSLPPIELVVKYLEKALNEKVNIPTGKYSMVLYVDENDKVHQRYYDDVKKDIVVDGTYNLVRLNNGHFAVINNFGRKIEFIPEEEREKYVDVVTNTPLNAKAVEALEKRKDMEFLAEQEPAKTEITPERKTILRYLRGLEKPEKKEIIKIYKKLGYKTEKEIADYFTETYMEGANPQTILEQARARLAKYEEYAAETKAQMKALKEQQKIPAEQAKKEFEMVDDFTDNFIALIDDFNALDVVNAGNNTLKELKKLSDDRKENPNMLINSPKLSKVVDTFDRYMEAVDYFKLNLGGNILEIDFADGTKRRLNTNLPTFKDTITEQVAKYKKSPEQIDRVITVKEIENPVNSEVSDTKRVNTNDSFKKSIKDSFTNEEYKEFIKLCKQLNLNTLGDVKQFADNHGGVKDKELLTALRLAANDLVTDATDNTKYYLYYIPYNQVDGKKIYYVGHGKMAYIFKSKDSGYKPKEVTFDEAVKIAKQFKQQESAKLYLEDIISKDTISITDEVPAKYKLCFEGEDTYDMFDETDIEDIYISKLPEDITEEAAIKAKLKEIAKKVYDKRKSDVNADDYVITFDEVYITEDGKYVQSVLTGYLPLKIKLNKK